jgi:hypothetical protein
MMILYMNLVQQEGFTMLKINKKGFKLNSRLI